MPRIPGAAQVQSSGMMPRDPGLSVRPSGFGGEALIHAGKAIGSLSDVAFRMAAEDDRAATQNHLVALDKGISDALLSEDENEPGFLTRRKGDAVGGFDSATKRIEKIYADTAAAISSPGQRRQFEAVGQNRLSGARDAMLRHLTVQRREHHDETDDAVIASASNRAAAFHGSPDMVSAAVMEAELAAENKSRRGGSGAEALAQARAHSRNSVYTAAIAAAAASDPLAARDLLARYAGNMDATVAADLGKKLRPAVVRATANAETARIQGMAGGGQGVPADFADRVAMAESGGRADARNPNSSAAGPGQFVDGTWLATVKKHRPDIAAGKSDAELLALRTDPKQAEFSKEMVGALAQDNAASLQAAGLAATDGNLYLAHFAGAEGARKLLTAAPDAPADTVLSDDAVKANPWLKGKTVGQVISALADKVGDKVGGSGGNDTVRGGDGGLAWQLAQAARHGDPEVRDMVEAKLSADHKRNRAAMAEQDRAVAESRARLVSDLTIGIADGTVTEDMVADQKSNLAPDQYTSLRLRARKREDDAAADAASEAATFARIEAAVTGAAPLDPKSKEDRDVADAWWRSRLPGLRQEPGERFPARAAAIVAEIGIVPEQVQASIRGRVRSGTPEQQVQAADMLGRLRSANPQLLNDFDAKDVAKSLHILSLTESGVPPEHAVEMVDKDLRATDIEKKTRAEEYKKQVPAGASAKWLADKMGDSWLPFTDPKIDSVMAAEFDELAEMHFRDRPDLDVARKAALVQISRVWSVSELDGNKRVVKYAPEQLHGRHDMTGEENAKWQREQLIEDLRQRDAALGPRLSLGDTDNALAAKYGGFTIVPQNKGDEYLVLINRGDGTVLPVRWAPDWATSPEKRRRDEARTSEIDKAQIAADVARLKRVGEAETARAKAGVP